MRATYAFLAALLLSLQSTAWAQARTAPTCYFEQVAQQSLQSQLNSPDVLNGLKEPPGTIIMTGPFGDPLYQGSGWEKRAYTEYMRQSLKPNPGEYQRFVQRFVVQQHYMWNSITRQSAQIKFSTTESQGCVGEKVIAGAWIEGEAILGEAIVSYPDLFSIRSAGIFQWGRNNYIVTNGQTLTGTVYVGPMTIVGYGFGTVGGSIQNWGGCSLSNPCFDVDY